MQTEVKRFELGCLPKRDSGQTPLCILGVMICREVVEGRTERGIIVVVVRRGEAVVVLGE